MAGHSKWHNIKNRKGAQDARKAKQFSEVSKKIKIAVKKGGSGDPNSNPILRLVMEKAREYNMPKDKVQRAIDRGLGRSASGATYEEVVYEGFAAGGVAVMVAASTDNKQRAAADIRHAFSIHGGSLGGPGSAAYLFTRTADGEFTPTMLMEPDSDSLASLVGLVDALRELDDVEDVYVAAELPSDDNE